jgi:hypothetical protein
MDFGIATFPTDESVGPDELAWLARSAGARP